MKFFVDTADVAEIKALAATGLVDGVTTHPPLVAKSGQRIADVIAEIDRNDPALKTEVLVASVRSPRHVITAARLGAHVATVPPNVLRRLFVHPPTEKGLAVFLADWARSGQSIA